MRTWLIKKLGGYTAKEYDALKFELENELCEDAEYYAGRIEELEAKIPDGRTALAEIVKDHFRGINEDDILKSEEKVVKDEHGRPQKKKVWYHKGRKLDAGEVEALKRDAQEFYDSNFYNLLRNEVEYHAMRQQMVNHSVHPDQIIEGKMLMYLWDVVKTRTKKFIEM